MALIFFNSNACISKYLELSEAPKCPECAKSLQANEIYPNFALQAAMQFAVDARDESNPSLISLSKDDCGLLFFSYIIKLFNFSDR